MKRLTRILFKVFGGFAALVIAYFLTAVLLSLIPSSTTYHAGKEPNEILFLSTNGVHLDFVIPIERIDSELKSGLILERQTKFVAFGWGDEKFYLNTPTWNDLTLANAFRALFLKSSTLMHVTNYSNFNPSWKKVKLTKQQLIELNQYILHSFELNEEGAKVPISGAGYSKYDSFYKATGSYSCFNTCNTWVNSGLKECNLPSCLWTPFDFSVLNKY